MAGDAAGDNVPPAIVVYYSDSPYATWSGPITLATGIIANDDIAVVTALPGKIGVFWGNENTSVQRFGFRTHIDGTDPGTWTADEVPASQSAVNGVGTGMADDHMNVAVASDGTLYAAVKTSYDTAGYPRMALLVRRPAGTWDNLYGLDEAGTRPIVLLDEANGVLTVHLHPVGRQQPDRLPAVGARHRSRSTAGRRCRAARTTTSPAPSRTTPPS